MSNLTLLAHSASGYAPRTTVNAKIANLTVAFAVNYDSAGEKLTKRSAGAKYVALPLHWSVIDSARVLYQAIKKHKAAAKPDDAFVLNIAGNSLHTLQRSTWDQTRIDDHIFRVLHLCYQHLPFDAVRSGGQTGADEAGIVAAIALDLPATALFPGGFKQRTARGEDIYSDPEVLRTDWMARAQALKAGLAVEAPSCLA